jgi:hypothetical protein
LKKKKKRPALPLTTNAISNTGELYDWNEFDVLLKHEKPRNTILFS